MVLLLAKWEKIGCYKSNDRFLAVSFQNEKIIIIGSEVI